MKRHLAETNQSLAMAENIMEDIVIDMLSRLPVKSLMRFKCVSKRWQSLISDQHFAKLCLQRLLLENITPSQKIIQSNPLQTIDYEALDDDEVIDHVVGKDEPWGLTGSCHGLPGSGLVAEHEFFHGFGYDSTTDGYKIVQGVFFKANDGSKECAFKIFSLRSGSWRRVPSKYVPKLDGAGIYLNRAVHWITNHGSGNRIEQAIIPFSLATETFEEAIPIPKVEGIVFEGLGIHGGRPFIYDVTWRPHFGAWIMNENRNGGSWTRSFSVVTDGLPTCQYYAILTAYTRSGNIVFQINVSEMILFNPENGTYKNYSIEESHNVESAIYVETLVSPNFGQ
ncbi:hypothetical protein BT93_H1552 [Corymbia citriodora subsp. variegata]|nr:hypothetical protein BT93_H1552 [Corymbia citriodora subsp. variegata]